MRRYSVAVAVAVLLAGGIALSGQSGAQRGRAQPERARSGVARDETPRGRLQERERQIPVTPDPSGPDEFRSKRVLDETRTGPLVDETPRRGTLSEEPTARPGFEVARRVPGRVDPELPTVQPARPEDPSRQGQASALDLSLSLGEKPLDGREAVRGTLAVTGTNMVVVRDESRVGALLRFRVAHPRALAALQKVTGLVQAVAGRVEDPAGPVEGVALRSGDRLIYLAERLHDTAALAPNDRDGVRLRYADPSGKPVLEDACRTVYVVPVTITKGQQSVTLSPGQTGALRADDGEYEVTLLTSRVTRPRECGLSFEDPLRFAEYLMWRVR